jgi:hypothetical protein
MSEETPNFNVDPNGRVTALAQFPYKGRRVEIVPPDTRHLMGNLWQIKIDAVLQRDLWFSSLRVAADLVKELIEHARGADRTGVKAVRLSILAVIVMMATPAFAVELFRYRGAAKDGGTLEYVFDAGEQNSPTP